jgi:hypothetical protein
VELGLAIAFSIAFALTNGANDAQKAMGVIAALLLGGDSSRLLPRRAGLHHPGGGLLGGRGRRRELATAALDLGRRLYAEKPKAFSRRLRGYWTAWPESYT